jgi:hypothetical protein
LTAIATAGESEQILKLIEAYICIYKKKMFNNLIKIAHHTKKKKINSRDI